MHRPREPIPAPIRLTLVGGGVACILGSLLLGFFLAHTSADATSKRLLASRDLVAQNMAAGYKNYNVNIPPWEPPGASSGIMWATFGVGCFLTISGIKTAHLPRADDRPEKAPWPEI